MGSAAFTGLAALLGPDERERAARFRFGADRARAVVARGALRCILSHYLGGAPGAVRLTQGPHGKPAISNGSARALHFNVSHAGEIVLLAFTRNRRVGIDVEPTGRPLDSGLLADVCLTPAERRALSGIPEERRTSWLLRLWTRKEAFLKATGLGLHYPARMVHVLDPLLGTRPSTFGPRDEMGGVLWSGWDLVPDRGHVGALVVEGEGEEPTFWQWSPPPERRRRP